MKTVFFFPTLFLEDFYIFPYKLRSPYKLGFPEVCFLCVLESETQQGIFDAVLKGDVDFESDPWPVISDSAKDLISKMLCSRPSERLTAHEVLRAYSFYLE